MNVEEVMEDFLQGRRYNGNPYRYLDYLDNIRSIRQPSLHFNFADDVVEVPANIARKVIAATNSDNGLLTIFPLRFVHRLRKKLTVGTSIIWSALEKTCYGIEGDSDSLNCRCFIIIVDENTKFYAAPGMLIDQEGRCLFRIVTRLEKDPVSGYFTATKLIMYVHPIVFIEKNTVNKAITSSLIPTLLQSQQEIGVNHLIPVIKVEERAVPTHYTPKPNLEIDLVDKLHQHLASYGNTMLEFDNSNDSE